MQVTKNMSDSPTNEMNVSIVLAAHNGERYIRAQLDSFCRQTRLPDELIIVDDASTDETVEICNEFKRAASFKVIVVQNEVNQGLNRTFQRAVAKGTS